MSNTNIVMSVPYQPSLKRVCACCGYTEKEYPGWLSMDSFYDYKCDGCGTDVYLCGYNPGNPSITNAKDGCAVIYQPDVENIVISPKKSPVYCDVCKRDDRISQLGI